MQVVKYILLIQKILLVLNFASISALIFLLLTFNPMTNGLFIPVSFFLFFLFLSSFLTLSGFFYYFSLKKRMISKYKTNLLLARSSVVSMVVVTYLAALVSEQDNFYIKLFLGLFLGFYLLYIHQLD